MEMIVVVTLLLLVPGNVHGRSGRRGRRRIDTVPPISDSNGATSTLVPVPATDHTGLPACCQIERDLMFTPGLDLAGKGSDTTSPDIQGLSEMVPSFGQFSLSHDNALTTRDPENIVHETCGGDFSFPVETNKLATDGSGAEENVVSASTDASNVYGSEEEGRLDSILNEDTGFLLVDEDNLPPKGACPMANPRRRAASSMFCVGDKRGNENPQLLVHHFVWVREHNWQANRLRKRFPDWSGATVFTKAREIVVAEMQKVMAYEMLESIFGRDNALPPFQQTCTAPPTGNVRIFKEFSQAIWRVPHAMINNDLELREYQGTVRTRSLDSVFFVPEVASSYGVEAVLGGMMQRPAKRTDLVYAAGLVVSQSPLSPNVHLGAKDCLRGRGSNMATYSQTREFFGLGPVSSWADISSSGEIQDQLEAVYGAGNWDRVDLLVGTLAEDHLVGGSVGTLFREVTKAQLFEIRCNDPAWFERSMSAKKIKEIKDTTFADIILRNTSPDLLPAVPKNPFKVASDTNPLIKRTCNKQMPM